MYFDNFCKYVFLFRENYSRKFKFDWFRVQKIQLAKKPRVVDHSTKYVTSARLSVSKHPPPLSADVGNQNNVNNNY